ncbi:FdrA family protein [Epidermidibacterium keratini]|uniref:FdrA family protein n=1 Tax=Epidermidibacterium keratini TaxID=1891644 RepID=A0A7L4YI66_9ACTN|nr:FdrA family protein [Epidermidibacterium keratini]QHB98979.1 FdrA family protein [Epidermidibacterium keratini]
MTEHIDVRTGVYYDSVTLLRITQAARSAPGVTAAQVAMATELNLDLARGMGFEVPADVTTNDLLITLRGDDQGAIDAGIAALEGALADAAAAGRAAGGLGSGPAPRTVRGAAASHPDAPLALLSVPGQYVLGEAMDAIAAGRHVMIFSDNVPIDDELAIKRAAAQAGVLVMGPDCGTAIVGGVGLGFANVLGEYDGQSVGVIAASGTGAQHVTALLDDAKVDVSHVLGLGGRDLSEQVGGMSALQALQLLGDDPQTDRILVISKPPHPATADKVRAAADQIGKPVTYVLLGPGQPTITDGVGAVLDDLGIAVPAWRTWNEAAASSAPGALRGLYSGGTLADEAMLVASGVLGDIRSNIPLSPELALPADATAAGTPDLTGLGNVVVDLGDDEFTAGRPHPMIDPTVRLDLLAAQAADPEVSVILLDVVLGHSAEADPAARLAPAIADALASAGRPLSVVVALCGTDGDPQGRDRQADALAAAGAAVYTSNAEAAQVAANLAAGRTLEGARA